MPTTQQRLPSACPSCGGPLEVSQLSCGECGTGVSGKFAPCACAILEPRLKTFHDVFLKCRGNIKDVERTLEISYPTVRGLLDELIIALFGSVESVETSDGGDILSRLERGEITAAEAAKLLKGGN